MSLVSTIFNATRFEAKMTLKSSTWSLVWFFFWVLRFGDDLSHWMLVSCCWVSLRESRQTQCKVRHVRVWLCSYRPGWHCQWLQVQIDSSQRRLRTSPHSKCLFIGVDFMDQQPSCCVQSLRPSLIIYSLAELIQPLEKEAACWPYIHIGNPWHKTQTWFDRH